MKRPTKRELVDAEYWQVLARALGWQLSGWTFQRHATFYPEGVNGRRVTVSLTGLDRDDIMRAIETARGTK